MTSADLQNKPHRTLGIFPVMFLCDGIFHRNSVKPIPAMLRTPLTCCRSLLSAGKIPATIARYGRPGLTRTVRLDNSLGLPGTNYDLKRLTSSWCDSIPRFLGKRAVKTDTCK